MPLFGLDIRRRLARFGVIRRRGRYITYRPYVYVFKDGNYAIATDEKGREIAKSTDFSYVMQEALNYLVDKGGTLYVAVADYILTSKITIPLNNRKIVIESNGAVIDCQNLNINVFYGDGLKNVTIRGFIFKNAGNHVVLIQNSEKVTIEKCEIWYGEFNGIVVKNTKKDKIR